MSRGETLIHFLRSQGGQAELGAIQDAFYKSTVAYSMTQAVSEARNKLKASNETIKCYKNKEPSKNLYVIEPKLELFERAA